jgi:hypothetical protein
MIMKLFTSILLLVAVNPHVGQANDTCTPLTGEYSCIDEYGDITNDLNISFPSANQIQLNTDIIHFSEWTPLADESDLIERYASAQCVQGTLFTDHKATDINFKTGQKTGAIEWRTEWSKGLRELVVRSAGKITPINGVASSFSGEYYCRTKNELKQNENECPDLSGEYRCSTSIQNIGPIVSIRRKAQANDTFTYYIEDYAINSGGQATPTPNEGAFRNGNISGKCRHGRFVISLDADLYRGETLTGRAKVKMARRVDHNGDLLIANKGELIVDKVIIPINGKGVCRRASKL